MPARPATAQRLMAWPRSLARRVFPTPVRRLDSIHDRIAAIETRQEEHLTHIRNLAERIETLSVRLADLESALNARMDDLAERSETAVALGWDHVAMTRRLAAIEDRLGAFDTAGDKPLSPRALAS